MIPMSGKQKFNSKTDLENIENNAEVSRFVGTAGVVMGVGALAVAVVNACQKNWDVTAMCALAGAFSTALGAWNLVNARDTYARLQELRRGRFEGWYHDWDM